MCSCPLVVDSTAIFTPLAVFHFLTGMSYPYAESTNMAFDKATFPHIQSAEVQCSQTNLYFMQMNCPNSHIVVPPDSYRVELT